MNVIMGKVYFVTKNHPASSFIVRSSNMISTTLLLVTTSLHATTVSSFIIPSCNNNNNNNNNIYSNDQLLLLRRYKTSSTSTTRNKSSNNNDWMTADGWDNFDPLKETSTTSTSTGRTTIPASPSTSSWGRSNNNSYNNSNNRDERRNDNNDRRSNTSNRNRNDNNDRNYRGGNNNNNSNRYPRQQRQEYGGGDDRRKVSTNDNNNNSYNNNNSNREFRVKSPNDVKINMAAFDLANLVHLYGLSSVLNALIANKRNFGTHNNNNKDNNNDNDNDNYDNNIVNEGTYTNGIRDNQVQQQQQQFLQNIKPEAQTRPYLFIQDTYQRSSTSSTGSSSTTRRTSDKVQQADRVIQLAIQRNIPIAYVDKGVLNTLSGNRPHQGYVLRCGLYEFTPITYLPTPTSDTDTTTDNNINKLWLALDEVVDPQNLGALIRSSYFMGQTNVIVCAKNSAPPSATVSSASAGALEIATIYSTSNLQRTLEDAERSGYRIIGASATGDENSNIPIYNIQDLPPIVQGTSNNNDQQQQQQQCNGIVLVLGSEGRGLRPLVAKSCTEFVRIPSGSRSSSSTPGFDTSDNYESQGGGVDSLNVSVTGGILLWHLLQQLQKE